MTMPVRIVLKALQNWTETLEEAERNQDWTAIRHTRLSMQQALVMMQYRLEQIAAAPPE